MSLNPKLVRLANSGPSNCKYSPPHEICSKSTTPLYGTVLQSNGCGVVVGVEVGVGVFVGVGVYVGVRVGVLVGVGIGVRVLVAVAARVGVSCGVGVWLGVRDGVMVARARAEAGVLAVWARLSAEEEVRSYTAPSTKSTNTSRIIQPGNPIPFCSSIRSSSCCSVINGEDS